MKKIAILLGLVLLVLNCTNNKPLPNGYDLIERENKAGLMPVITLEPINWARYWDSPVTGGYTTLLLGDSQNIQSSILLKCRNLIKIDTTAKLISTTLRMYGSYLFGDDSLMTISMHRVNSDWVENSVLMTDVDGTFDTEPLEQVDFTFHKNDWADIPIANFEFMSDWILDSYQAEQSIHGLLISSTSANLAAEFVSSDATANPAYIQVVTENSDGGNDTTKAFLSHDASLLRYTSEVEPEVREEKPQTLRIGNASGYSSFIQFDVSAIPAEATIHKALLSFYVDAEESNTRDDVSMSISAARLVGDSLWTPSTIELDSLSLPASDLASAESELFAFDSNTPIAAVSKIVQQWISVEESPNFGFLLLPQYPGKDFQELSLKTGALDPVFTPTLVITYSLPPSHRFAN